MTNLTDLAIRKLPIPRTGRKTYWDKGLGVRVSSSGTKTFLVKHQNRLQTIGLYPSVSLKTARQEALRIKVEDNPQKRLERLSEARRAYLDECGAKNRPNTVRMYRQYLHELDKPFLSDVKRTDIDLTDPHRVTAWKVFFNWCIRNELAEKNPFAHQSATYSTRSRVLSDDELKLIWQYEHPPFSTYLKLSILTGQRRGQWQECTVQNDTIIFPASIMKNGYEHTIPLTDWTASLLPVPKFSGWSKGKARIDRHVPLTHWTIHDLRRTFSTTMASLQVPLHVTEQILAHRSGSISGVAATYNRYNYLNEMRDALGIYEDHLRETLDVRQDRRVRP